MNQKTLAGILGISQQSVSLLIQQGMPTDSGESAARWRAANLHPGRIKSPAPPPLPLPEVLAQAARLLAVGESVAPLLPKIREALRRLPAAERAEIRMSQKLWDLLTEGVRRQLADVPREELSPAEAAEMGAFWFEAATGKWRANP